MRPDHDTPPAFGGVRSEPEFLAAKEGPLGGPSYTHRGAIIDCQPGGHICRLLLPGCPLHGHSFGAAGTIPYLVDLWLDHQRLPPWIKAARPAPGYRDP